MSNPVVVAPYDPNWPRRFDAERRVLAAVFTGSNAVIEHIGSTAVQGLGAKPIIDVMAGLETLADVETRIPALEAIGYEYVRKHETQIPERRYFRKPRLEPRAVHLHCVVNGGDFWIRQLAFRDYLRRHPDTAEAYYHLKRGLAERYPKEQYTQAKSSFIEGVLDSALRSGERP